MKLSETQLRQRAKASAALRFQSGVYPARYRCKVPLKVLMLQTVRSDLPYQLGGRMPDTVALTGVEYFVTVNSNGAVTAIFDNGGSLGIRPAEFEIIEFHK